MIGICSVDGFMFRVLVEVDKIFWQWISEAHRQKKREGTKNNLEKIR